MVLARSLGVLKRDEVGRAMRSCFPDFVCPRKKAAGVALVDEEAEDLVFDDDEGQFEDVEQFLAEQLPIEADDCFEEVDIADVLAVSWKEKRKELNRLRRSRCFQEADQLKRQFRVEVEELKKKTRCHRCNQLGHWSRECKKPKGSGKGKSDTSSSKGDSGAAFVEHFVATISWQSAKESFETLVQKMKARKQWKHEAVAGMGPRESLQELLLVSSPGFGILDSGCGKTIVGRETFKEFQELWRAHGIPLP